MTREEALQNIKKAIGFSDTLDESIFTLFPELKESEDERIRKWLYDYISNCPNNNFAFYGGVGKDAVLNYLEKQKEQKQTPDWMPKFLDELRTKSYLDWDEHKEMEGKVLAIIHWIAPNYFDTEQKEQKPIQSEDEKEYVRTLKGLVSDLIRDCGGSIPDIGYYQQVCDWLDGRHVEQKPVEWSEDDKFKLEDAITGIDVGIGFYEKEGKHPNLLKAIIEAKEWLKSLRPQPKNEWSEKNMPKWKKVTDYTKLPTDAIVRYESDKNLQTENAISEQDVSRILGFRKPIAYYLTPDDLNKLPKED